MPVGCLSLPQKCREGGMKYFSLNHHALSFALRILLGCVIAWWTLDLLNDTRKVWALISVIVVSDPDFNAIRQNAVSRMVNTLVGCLIGLFFIYFFGVGFWPMMAAVAVSVIISTSFKNYPSSWKMAPVTVIILSIPVMSGPETLKSAMSVAINRTGEVLYGSLIALLLGLIYYKIEERYLRKIAAIDKTTTLPVKEEMHE